MNRASAMPYVSFVLDDALSADHALTDIRDDARLVGWQCGFEPLFVAVQSYLPGVRIDDSDAEDIAMEFLVERGWFAGEPREADYIL